MGNLPFEVLVNVLSFMPFHEKHVFKRVNSLWAEAADAAIGMQKELAVHRDDVPQMNELEHEAVGECSLIHSNHDDHISVFSFSERLVRNKRETCSGRHQLRQSVCLFSCHAAVPAVRISQR